MSNYFNMNEVQVGTRVKIIKSGLIGFITEVFHFPTTFKVEFEDPQLAITPGQSIVFYKKDFLIGGAIIGS